MRCFALYLKHLKLFCHLFTNLFSTSYRFLKQLRKNRDEENELMKDVPGWETGTLWGEPVYHNLVNRFPWVNPEEYYAHVSPKDMYDRMFEKRHHWDCPSDLRIWVGLCVFPLISINVSCDKVNFWIRWWLQMSWWQLVFRSCFTETHWYDQDIKTNMR